MSWHEWLFMAELDDGGFGAPGYLWWLLAVPTLAGLLTLMGWIQTQRLQRLFRGDLAKQVRPTSVRVRRTIRDVLLLVALTCGVLALAGPRYGKEVHVVKQKGVDMVLVVDLSRSMEAQDVDPSRLERVRREVVDLLDMIGSDRVGLVVFAGGAYARMPLSQDHQALRQLIDEMSTNDFQAQGSAMGEAIRTATELLTHDENSKAGRAVLLLSDGEVHNPSEGLAAASEARDAGVRLYAMGVGTEAAPIPLGNGLWQLDKSGRRVLSRPSPEYLKELARIGGGAYHDSTPSDTDMRKLYREGIRASVEAGLVGSRPKVRWRKAYQWPLGLGVFAALIAVWLGEGRRRWGMAAVVMLAVGLAVHSPALAGSVAEGDKAFRASKFREAERIFTELTYDRPNDPDLYRRLGAARYRVGDFEGAARAWERQATIEGEEGSESLYNAGNAHARAGRIERALERYEQAMERGPHPAAEKNRKLLQNELERRKEEQQQRQQQNQQGQEQEQQGQEGQQGEQQEGQPGEQQGQQGEKQEGQQGQAGEQEQGEEGDKGDKPEPGEQEGEQTEGGGADGPQEQSDRSQSGENPTKQQGGQKQTSDDQERQDESQTGEGVKPSDVEGDPEGQAGAEGANTPAEPVDVEVEAADKLIDSAKEGRPRISIPGGEGDKPW